ncbi:hypothetical protein [Labrenzia sp. CE80]|uniref:hypothetical protein n=1 Tax=Labrenzia sp. CE80 TaxID=1788986 RepID=UPI001AD8A7E4|nr:hypothetical protein [Labrenzia sp. CE80]
MNISALASTASSTPFQQASALQSGVKVADFPVARQEISSVSGAEKSASAPAKPTGSNVSSDVASVLIQQQELAPSGAGDKIYSANTGNGFEELDFDAYFSDTPSAPKSLEDVGFLLPSADNIAALTEHASARFQQVLDSYGIPAPDNISYDERGNMKLPADYQYRDELEQALEENPGLDRELRTLNALASHYAEIQKLAPFREEYSAAGTQAEIDAVLQRYNHLLKDNNSYSKIALNFSDDGSISLTADGNEIQLT